jgi:hypothetical protein
MARSRLPPDGDLTGAEPAAVDYLVLPRACAGRARRLHRAARARAAGKIVPMISCLILSYSLTVAAAARTAAGR